VAATKGAKFTVEGQYFHQTDLAKSNDEEKSGDGFASKPSFFRNMSD
jgi:hypothetical protein